LAAKIAALQCNVMARPPRIPVWPRAGEVITYFMTLCVAGRKPVLDNPNTFEAITRFCNQNSEWDVLAAVVMPDHVHALVRPLRARDAAITQFSAGFKRFVRRQTNADWKWQEGVFDRLLRKDEFAQSKRLYMRDNPVRAKLVDRWDDWPYLIGSGKL
jgi:REP element-mobilizing transposase RayT